MNEASASPDNVRLLERCLLFQALGDGSKRDLASQAYRRTFAAGDSIFRAGDAGQTMLAVTAGSVRISLGTSHGKGIILDDLGTGELIGEIAVLDGGARSADATALTNCEVLVLDRAEVLPVLERRPDVCIKLMELLCARVRRSDERMFDIAFFDVATRLAKTLLRESGPPRLGHEAKLSISQSVLANMIGATRENVNRHLRDWHRRGILVLRDGWIVISNHDALAAIAGAEVSGYRSR